MLISIITSPQDLIRRKEKSILEPFAINKISLNHNKNGFHLNILGFTWKIHGGISVRNTYLLICLIGRKIKGPILPKIHCYVSLNKFKSFLSCKSNMAFPPEISLCLCRHTNPKQKPNSMLIQAKQKKQVNEFKKLYFWVFFFPVWPLPFPHLFSPALPIRRMQTTSTPTSYTVKSSPLKKNGISILLIHK